MPLVMDRSQGRRLLSLALLCGCLLVFTWIESVYHLNYFELPFKIRTKRSAINIKSADDTRQFLKNHQIRNDHDYEKMRLKLNKKLSFYNPLSEQFSRLKFQEETSRIAQEKGAAAENDAENNILPETSQEYFEDVAEIENRLKQIRSRVYRCMPKFICEVHSQPPEKASTDFEKEWLNVYSPGMLSDRVHEYQMAAHMGQLFRGYQPSPCGQVYTGCPISLEQLKKVIFSFDTKKSGF